MQPANKHTHTHTHTHKALTSCITWEIQLKTTRKPTEYLVEWVKLKYLQHQVLSRICNNQSTYTYNAIRNLKCLVVSYKIVLILTSRPNICMPKHLPKRNKKCIFYKRLNVHIKFILNSLKLETIQIPTPEEWKTKCDKYIMECCSAIKTNELLL